LFATREPFRCEPPGSDGPATKPILVADCPDPITVHVHAVTERVRFGNAFLRYDQEAVAAVLATAAAAHARTAKQRLLNGIAAASTVVTSAAYLEAARDLLTDVELAAVAYRSRHRTSPQTVLRAVLPAWARGVMRRTGTHALRRARPRGARRQSRDDGLQGDRRTHLRARPYANRP